MYSYVVSCLFDSDSEKKNPSSPYIFFYLNAKLLVLVKFMRGEKSNTGHLFLHINIESNEGPGKQNEVPMCWNPEAWEF